MASDYIKNFDEIEELMKRKYKHFKNILKSLNRIKFEVSGNSYLIYRDGNNPMHKVICWKPTNQKESRYSNEKVVYNQQQLFDYLQYLEKLAKGYEERNLFD